MQTENGLQLAILKIKMVIFAIKNQNFTNLRLESRNFDKITKNVETGNGSKIIRYPILKAYKCAWTHFGRISESNIGQKYFFLSSEDFFKILVILIEFLMKL